MGTVFSSKKGIFLTNATIHKMGSAAFHAPKSTKKDTPIWRVFLQYGGPSGTRTRDRPVMSRML